MSKDAWFSNKVPTRITWALTWSLWDQSPYKQETHVLDNHGMKAQELSEYNLVKFRYLISRLIATPLVHMRNSKVTLANPSLGK